MKDAKIEKTGKKSILVSVQDSSSTDVTKTTRTPGTTFQTSRKKVKRRDSSAAAVLLFFSITSNSAELTKMFRMIPFHKSQQ